MNYAVYTYAVIDGQVVCHIYAYKMVTDPVEGTGFHLMTKDEAQALANGMTEPGLTKMVLPLEPNQSITQSF